MRILSITAQKPHSTGSGVYLTELVRQWHRQGHRQSVVAGIYHSDCVSFPPETAFYPVYFDTPALPFHIVGMSDAMPYPNTRYRDLTSQTAGQFRAAFRQAVTLAVERENPDLIVCHHLYLLTAMVRSWFPDKKVVAVCHGTDLRQFEKIPLERELIYENISRLDGIFALHGAQKKEIERLFSCPPEKIQVVGAGYNHDIFYPAQTQPQTTQRQLVFAGKVTEKKGVFSLLRALERLPYPREALRVTLAGGPGSPEEFEQVRALARASRYPVELPGPLPQPQLAELFRQSGLFVLPSFFEGLPLVNLEAMACGCRVVCTDLPGISSWYDSNVPGHGIRFVPPPPMKHVDEADPDALPAFEERLAQALREQMEAQSAPAPDLSHISWQGISQKILALSSAIQTQSHL